MEVLFLCHRIPFPPNKGDKIRSHALLTHLARNHRVHVACFVDDPADMVHCDAVREIAGGECIFVPLTTAAKWLRAARACVAGQPITTACLRARELRQCIACLTAKYRIDCTLVFSSGMAGYVLNSFGLLDPAHAILDMVDIDSDKWRQYAEMTAPPRRWIFRREAEKLEEFERAAAAKFSATLFVSGFEADTFARIAPECGSRVCALTNGVDLDYFAPGQYPNPFAAAEIPIVMTGRMDYLPNIDGVDWFLDEVLPRVKLRLPEARLHAVGANPPRKWRQRFGADFVVHDHVRDVRPYIQHAACLIAPLRIARGIQNKILEAMAMAKPVVATREATRALNVRSGFEMFVENGPDTFANAIAEAVRRGDVGQNARRYAEQHHNWRTNLVALDHMLDEVADPGVRPPNPATCTQVPQAAE